MTRSVRDLADRYSSGLLLATPNTGRSSASINFGALFSITSSNPLGALRADIAQACCSQLPAPAGAQPPSILDQWPHSIAPSSGTLPTNIGQLCDTLLNSEHQLLDTKSHYPGKDSTAQLPDLCQLPSLRLSELRTTACNCRLNHSWQRWLEVY